MYMKKEELFNMLKQEIESKVDSETLKKLGAAGSKEETLSILSKSSVELDEDVLSAIAGGDSPASDLLENGLEWNCPTACDWHFCPSACLDFLDGVRR